ncbi:uncharacterized protein LACBIDRAFT_336339 [Laccaria bicolor S238N-H82]|uniref:Predicted protein n=1 Tax=Laccaria bicolor (strain S238N-H82 / ATCC MYA-4686) TaxID=486041 RepID=B0E557_LACBS|nr:uncharacterized protein LACBIDRAFT_336339 [Laccaria bicolor S238N-H82]EDQ98023.1 predicted protein [Laccaria bicolor S238N-H82]|eukprot:XP_001891325.1 predicted protein [Laccaria bicolor S238N-H82]
MPLSAALIVQMSAVVVTVPENSFTGPSGAIPNVTMILHAVSASLAVVLPVAVNLHLPVVEIVVSGKKLILAMVENMLLGLGVATTTTTWILEPGSRMPPHLRELVL